MMIFKLKPVNLYLFIFTIVLYLAFSNFILVAIEGLNIYYHYSLNSLLLYFNNIFIPFLFYILYFRKPYKITVDNNIIMFKSIFKKQKNFNLQDLSFIYRTDYHNSRGQRPKFITFVFGNNKVELMDIIDNFDVLMNHITKIKTLIKKTNKSKFFYEREIFHFNI